jgi:hypothetical protein
MQLVMFIFTEMKLTMLTPANLYFYSIVGHRLKFLIHMYIELTMLAPEDH